MILPPPDSLERLTHADLIGVVRDLIGEVTRMQRRPRNSMGRWRSFGSSIRL